VLPGLAQREISVRFLAIFVLGQVDEPELVSKLKFAKR